MSTQSSSTETKVSRLQARLISRRQVILVQEPATRCRILLNPFQVLTRTPRYPFLHRTKNEIRAHPQLQNVDNRKMRVYCLAASTYQYGIWRRPYTNSSFLLFTSFLIVVVSPTPVVRDHQKNISVRYCSLPHEQYLIGTRPPRRSRSRPRSDGCRDDGRF